MKVLRGAALFIMAMAAILVLIPTTPSLAAPAQAQSDCKHLKLAAAVLMFPQLEDGKPSDKNKWTLAGGTMFYVGPTIQGAVPQGFYAIGSGLFRSYGGSNFVGDNLTLVCVVQSGATPIPYPPQRCSANTDEALDNIGGTPFGWTVRETTETYVSLVYFFAGIPVGGFVPLNGTVVDIHDPSKTYYPGDEFPITDSLILTCWKNKEAPPVDEPAASPAP